MKRENLKKIIKARSCWKIDKRKGDYELPNGEPLSHYLYYLIESQLRLDNLGIKANGDTCFMDESFRLMPAFENNEQSTEKEQKMQIHNLIWELIKIK